MGSISRREFVVGAAAAGAVLSAGFPKRAYAKAAPLELPALPYEENALEPFISAKTVGIHHGKHQKAYIDNTNKNIAGTPFAEMSLDKIILATAGKPDQIAVFNNAAQAWNHAFYWKSMRKAGGAPTGALKEKLAADFGGYEKFVADFTAAATGQFGSGWAWLVEDGGKLAVLKTGNADNPLTMKKKPLLTIDVWEHAYYLDYQNRRPDYVKAFVEHLINWDFVAENLKA